MDNDTALPATANDQGQQRSCPCPCPCPCGGGGQLADCCGDFLAGRAKPRTAEQLMRSRYTASVLADGRYLFRSRHPDHRDGLSPEQLTADAQSVTWQRLEVLAARGGPNDKRGKVEFRAWYQQDGLPGVLHERSRFVRTAGRWFYTSGELIAAPPPVFTTGA